ncbi:hypothetical protein FRB94_006410 [Tulasnella sp. JGI-2019a]|nr:hypothetical protein FRB94_006410 [Tulasnella sp. JGI-2019a]
MLGITGGRKLAPRFETTTGITFLTYTSTPIRPLDLHEPETNQGERNTIEWPLEEEGVPATLFRGGSLVLRDPHNSNAIKERSTTRFLPISIMHTVFANFSSVGKSFNATSITRLI